MIIEASAPARIDLAGGTLDIYPLYLFEEGGLTVNAAVTVGSTVRVETRTDSRVVLIGADNGSRQEAADLASLELGGPLDLVARVVRFYAPPCGVTVTTRTAAPQGSGLGSSSSLLISLSGALRHLTRRVVDDMAMVQYGAALEAQNIRVPTGKQDYYAALFGGLNAIWFEVEGDRVERLCVADECLSEFEQRLVLSFTGESRFSGASNWNMLRRYVDGESDTQEALRRIKQTSLAMRQALLAGDFPQLAAVLDEEWQNRKSLAEGVTTPQIERLMAATKEAGAQASKICGAGGGGCMITLCPPVVRPQVVAALEANDATCLPYRVDRHGLMVTERAT